MEDVVRQLNQYDREDYARYKLRELAREMAQVIKPIWQEGDGFGGSVRVTLGREFAKYGLPISREWEW